MKNRITFFMFFTMIFSQFCFSQKQTLGGREFLSDDSIKSESFIFLDDSICVYTQKYHCNIEEKYRLIIIKCKYKFSKELIILSPIEIPSYLEGADCFLLPDSILKECDLIYIDTPQNPFNLDIRGKLTRADIYRYINSVKNGEKLLYKGDNIIYAKVLTCFPIETRRSSFTPFTQKGEKRISDKKLKKLMKSGKIPVNNLISNSPL